MTTTEAPPRPAASVRVEDDEVVIDGFRESDLQVVSLVTGSERPEELVHQMLGVGARAIISTKGDLETERLAELFDKLAENFASATGAVTEELAEKTKAFLEEDGDLAQVLATFQETLTVQLGDPDSAKSLVSQMREILQKANEAHVEKLRLLFDPDQDGSPLQRQRLQTEKFIAQEFRVVREEMEGLGKELAVLRSVKEVYEKTTGKGFDFEDFVHEIVSTLVSPLGDVAEHVGKEHGDKKGDELVTLNPDDTSGRGLRYVLEVKDRKLSLNEIHSELDQAMKARDASCGVAVFSGQALAPSEVAFQYSGDKAIVVLDKDDPDSCALQVACLWARWVTRRSNEEVEGVDIEAVSDALGRLQHALSRVTTIRRAHTSAKNRIDEAVKQVEELNDDVETEIALLREVTLSSAGSR